MLDKGTYLGIIHEESDRLIKAARRDLAAPVPACPDWAVGDLVDHLGDVYGWVTTIARHQAYERDAVRDLTQRREAERAARTADPGFLRSPRLLEWVTEQRDEVISQLGQLDSDARVWVLAPGAQRGDFWPRRMAHETIVHRWDVEAAFNAAGPVDPTCAADGIDELVEVMIPRWRGRAKTPATGETFGFAATDAGRDWRVQVTPEKVVTGAEAGNPAVMVSGPAADLFLFLWHRARPDALTVSGDETLLTRYFDLIPPG